MVPRCACYGDQPFSGAEDLVMHGSARQAARAMPASVSRRGQELNARAAAVFTPAMALAPLRQRGSCSAAVPPRQREDVLLDARSRERGERRGGRDSSLRHSSRARLRSRRRVGVAGTWPAMRRGRPCPVGRGGGRRRRGPGRGGGAGQLPSLGHRRRWSADRSLGAAASGRGDGQRRQYVRRAGRLDAQRPQVGAPRDVSARSVPLDSPCDAVDAHNRHPERGRRRPPECGPGGRLGAVLREIKKAT